MASPQVYDLSDCCLFCPYKLHRATATNLPTYLLIHSFTNSVLIKPVFCFKKRHQKSLILFKTFFPVRSFVSICSRLTFCPFDRCFVKNIFCVYLRTSFCLLQSHFLDVFLCHQGFHYEGGRSHK